MNSNTISNKFEKTLQFFKNARVQFLSLGAGAATLFSLSGMSQKDYFHSLGKTPATQQPSVVARDQAWENRFNTKYGKGVGYCSLSHMVLNNPPLQTLVSPDIQQDKAHQALVTEMVETAQRLGLTPETTTSGLNTSVEKQASKTLRYGVSVGIGGTLNANFNVHNTPVGLPPETFHELQQEIKRLDSVGGRIEGDFNALKQQLTEMKDTFIASVNNEIAFNRTQLFNYRHPCELEFTHFDQNDDKEKLIGLTGRKFMKNAEGIIVPHEQKLTDGDLKYVLKNYGFEDVQIARVSDGARQLLRMEQSLHQAINNQQSLAETKTALTKRLETVPPGRKWNFDVSGSPAVVQVYTPLPVTQAQGSLSWDLKNSEISVGIGKSRLIAGTNSRLGFLVGADVHARWKAAPNPGFGGFGLKAFAGPVVNF